MIGQTISHYRILEKLGEGGMGVVYKAHDTTLDRDVALKFLPSYFTSDPSEKDRFHHEARAAAALTHQNIAVIHEIGTFKRPEDADEHLFIAMEYVRGETLKKLVGSESLTIRKVLDVAIQIAEGLAAAHEKGIVHRDIKCENIILTPKGQAKIMDFGLAKVKGGTKLTQTGSTLGTAAYMSPEQARGEDVDHRSDIFSFGVVLYELLAGRLPFRGEHPTALMYSIVTDEPEPIGPSNENVTPELERIVSKALTKDRDDRYQHADDLLADLRRERKKLDYAQAGNAAPSGSKRPSTVENRSRKRRRNLAIILVAVGVMITALVITFSGRTTDLNPDMTFRPLKLPYADVGYPGISGDGNWIAFGATDPEGKNALFLMHSSGGDLRQVIPTTGKAVIADLSPDGSRIAYGVYDNWTRTYNQYVISVVGGTPVNLGVGAGSWRFRPDGQRLGYIRGIRGDHTTSGKVEFWSVAVDGTDPRQEFVDSLHVGYDLGGAASSFSYSPDGKKVAWLRSFSGYSEVIVHDLETGDERAVTDDKRFIDEVAWLREDKIAYTTDKSGIFNVWVTSVDGPPVQITRETTSPPKGIKAATDGRRLVYLQKNLISDLWIVDIAGNKSRRITLSEDLYLYPQFSPDGKRIAFQYRGGDFEPWHIAVIDRDGGNRKQLSFGDEVATGPVWSPDGRWIAYRSRKMSEPVDSTRTYIIEPSNPGPPRFIANGTVDDWIDSARFHLIRNGTVYVTSVDGAPLEKVYDDSTLAFYTEGGRYIVYLDRRQGKDPQQWWIVDGTKPRDVQRKTARMLVKTKGIVLRGETFYWLAGIGEVWRMTIPDGKPTRIQADFLGVDNYEYFSPSRDGKEVIIGKWRHNSGMVLIENVFR